MSDPHHVILFCDVAATDGLENVPIHLVETAAIATDDAQAILAVHEDFIRRDHGGALSSHHQSHSKPDRNQLWFVRGAGARGEEIHAGYGETTLYRIVRVPVVTKRPASTGQHGAIENDRAAYDMLVSALSDAWKHGGGRVSVSMAGEHPRKWDLALGDHRAVDGAIRLGPDLTVLPDGSIAERPCDAIRWHGGHVTHDGSSTRRFTIGGIATTLQWRDARRGR